MRRIWYRSGDPDSLLPGMKKLIEPAFMRIAYITMCIINPKSAWVVEVFPLLAV